jgi:hypothetical protein
MNSQANSNAMTDQDIKSVAEGLSEAERNRLIAMGTGKTLELCMRHGLISFTLIKSGLMTFRRKWWLFGDYVFYLTKTGLKLRTYLQEQSNG